jgi:hypothetical protein
MHQHHQLAAMLLANPGGTGLTMNVVASGGKITSVVLNGGGLGFSPNSTLLVQIVGGTGNVILAQTNAAGAVTSVTLLNGGSAGYTTGPAQSATPIPAVFGSGAIAYLQFPENVVASGPVNLHLTGNTLLSWQQIAQNVMTQTYSESLGSSAWSIDGNDVPVLSSVGGSVAPVNGTF